MRYANINISMAKKKNINATFRLWINANDEKLLGKGRVELLERIDKTGSISHAAKQMKMSYRQAWQMVTEMNERGKQPVVNKQLGGRSGGGASVTEYGKALVEAFHRIEKSVEILINREIKRKGI